MFYLFNDFINREEPLEYWDYLYYWLKSHGFYQPVTFTNFIASLRWEDYNFAPVIFQAAVLDMFDMPSRKAYVLTTAAIYFIPLCYFYVKFFDVFSPGNLTRIVLFACIVTATPITRGMMMGQPDLCGILAIMILLVYCIRTDFSKFKMSHGIICGIMLFLPFVFRRWYAYTIVSLYITIPFFNMFIFRQGRFELKKIFNIFLRSLLPVVFQFCACILYSMSFSKEYWQQATALNIARIVTQLYHQLFLLLIPVEFGRFFSYFCQYALFQYQITRLKRR